MNNILNEEVRAVKIEHEIQSTRICEVNDQNKKGSRRQCNG